ncbi:MAG: DNA polymerase I [Patescibacteria group bacterium]
MVKKGAKKKLLVLLDTHAILHRAYHALPSFSSKGEPTGALYGLAAFLLKIIRELNPDYLIAASDLPEPTFRHVAYEKYKIQRPETDSDLASQIARAYDLLKAFSIPVYEHKGFEADDIIGTIAQKTAKEKNLAVIIASGDLDTLQLVEGKRVRVYTLKGGLSDTILYDEEKVKERYGFGPALLPDFKGLRGDPSDNIVGVPGIGEKTASALIQKFGRIEDIYKILKKNKKVMAEAGIKERAVKILEEHEEDAKFSKTLAQIRVDAPISFSLEGARFTTGFDKEKAEEMLKELGFLSLIARLPAIASLPSKVLTEEGVEGGEREEIGTKFQKNSDFLEGESDIWWCASKEGDGVWVVGRTGKIAAFETDEEKKRARELLQKNIRHRFCGAKKVFHLLSLDTSVKIASDLKVAAWLTSPQLQNPSVVNLVHAFLPEERLSDPPELGALSLLPKIEAKINREVEEKKLDRVLKEIELPLIPALFEMEKRGITVDKKLLKKLSKDFAKRLGNLEENIWKHAGTSFNPASPKQLAEVLFVRLGLSAPGLKKTATGARSTRESELLKLKNLHPIVGEILAFRELAKLKSTYVDALPQLADREGRVHTTYDQTGTVTGRLSSSEPNLQNIPLRSEFGRAVRAAFLASPGFELISFDYSQIELRIAAILSGDKKMQRAFREGRDIHRETASEIFNVPPSEVSDAMRRRAKTINFGILYGMGASALSQSLEISRGEAEKFLEEYFRDFSGVREYLERTKREAAERGFVETAYGRRRYLPEIYSKAEFIRKEAERMAVNAPIQGTAADIVKLAMIRAHDFIRARLPSGSAYLLLQIHDELLFEVKKDAVERVLPSVKDILEHVFSSPVPLTVDVKRGPNWAEMHKIA